MRGIRLPHFVESIDTFPTILDWLKVEKPDYLQGHSVLGHVHGRQDAEPRREIHYEYDFRGRAPDGMDPDCCLLWVVRDDDYKYVQFAHESMPPFLFNLRDDPEEQNNLAAEKEYAAVVAEYSQRLLRWRMKHEDQRMERWASGLRS